MYVYITCRPDIGYAISFYLDHLPSTTSYFEDLQYLRSTITLDIHYNQPTPIGLEKLEEPIPYKELANSKDDFPIGINGPVC